eukprot:gene15719-18677_t
MTETNTEEWRLTITDREREEIARRIVGVLGPLCGGATAEEILENAKTMEATIYKKQHGSDSDDGMVIMADMEGQDDVIDLDDLGKGEEEEDSDSEEDDDVEEVEMMENVEMDTVAVVETTMEKEIKSTSSQEEEEEDEEEDEDGSDDVGVEEDEEKFSQFGSKFDKVPKVVPLFFVHPAMTDAITEIECDYWESGVWNVTRAFDIFAQIIHAFYRDNKSLPSLTFAEIHENIHDTCLKKYSKFLESLGIDMHAVYVEMFSNITQDGQVSHSHTFYYLFPTFQEMKHPTHPIGDYYMTLKARLEKQGIFNKEVEKIVETLDRLVEERQLISVSSSASHLSDEVRHPQLLPPTSLGLFNYFGENCQC